jgi:hypothetical protein
MNTFAWGFTLATQGESTASLGLEGKSGGNGCLKKGTRRADCKNLAKELS